NGSCTPETKVFETRDAIAKGADEIDMVINIGELKAGNDAYVLDEIKQIKKACGKHILKVIIETCLLTEEEKIRACRIVTESGADFIKTSTGFSTGGATREDVALMKANVGPGVKVKAAGGIADLKDAEDFIALGAERLGTSRIVKAVKQLEKQQ
ncbi:MAG: deoxyribose-phosphate aldolase, partial [Firmicutes bacterium]|nr:deoxyribose-phosphate aldolase [Bacillota bacterium]